MRLLDAGIAARAHRRTLLAAVEEEVSTHICKYIYAYIYVYAYLYAYTSV